MPPSDITGIYILSSKIHSRAALSVLPPCRDQFTDSLPNCQYEVLVRKTKLIKVKLTLQIMVVTLNYSFFFSCAREVGATGTVVFFS